ncbi:MAG: SDR family oxidoreductase [Chthoniobacterales bacterium]
MTSFQKFRPIEPTAVSDRSPALICGATGMFGGGVLREMLSRGAPVVALCRSPERAKRLEDDGVPVAVADMDDPPSLLTAMTNVSRVFLVSPMDDRIARHETNVIEAAEKSGVRQIVKIFGAVRHQGDALVSQHEKVNERLKSSDLAWTLISPNTVMESNLFPAAPTIIEENAIYGASGDGKIGMVSLDDCVAAAATVLTGDIEAHRGCNHEITGPKALTFTEIAEEFSKALGRTIEYRDSPVDEFGRMLVAEAGFDADTVETEVLCHFRAFRRGDADLVTETFRKLTDRPSTSVAAFIERNRDRFTDPSKAGGPS